MLGSLFFERIERKTNWIYVPKLLFLTQPSLTCLKFYHFIRLTDILCSKNLSLRLQYLAEKMGSIQIVIKYLKRAANTLIFLLQIDMNQIF